jgi:hypothetical protein
VSEYVVTATSLNLRSKPVVAKGNVLGILPSGQRVETLDESDAAWFRVRTELTGQTIEGYASARFLAPAANAPVQPTHATIEAVHLAPNAGARLGSIACRQYPLLDANIPTRPNGTAAERALVLGQLVSALDVETSARYRPTTTRTYCNIYAYDFCYFAQAYLPRVWWYQKALLELSKGRSVAAAYGKTVYEQNANGLYDWLLEWGTDFGWTRSFDASELQDRANTGGVGVICAKRRDPSRSGHITCVVPEFAETRARRTQGRVVAPLQSQAGSKNRRYFNDPWWIERADQYQATAFFHHE